MKKKFLTASVALLLPLFAYFIHFSKTTDSALLSNIEALSDSEGSGLLWSKDWQPCTFFSVRITGYTAIEGAETGANTFMQGQTFTDFDLSFCEYLAANGYSFTIESGEGRKSYCIDGWWFCDEDDCR